MKPENPISQRFMGSNFGRNTCAFNIRNCLNRKLRATELRNYKLMTSPIVVVKHVDVVMASALIPISQRLLGNNFGRNTCAFNLRNCLNPKLRATELRNYKLVKSPIVFLRFIISLPPFSPVTPWMCCSYLSVREGCGKVYGSFGSTFSDVSEAFLET